MCSEEHYLLLFRLGARICGPEIIELYSHDLVLWRLLEKLVASKVVEESCCNHR